MKDREHDNIPDAFFDMMFNHPCIICGSIPSAPSIITNGQTVNGSNLIPLCKPHSICSMPEVYAESARFRRWLLEHDRMDAAYDIESKAIRMGLWKTRTKWDSARD